MCSTVPHPTHWSVCLVSPRTGELVFIFIPCCICIIQLYIPSVHTLDEMSFAEGSFPLLSPLSYFSSDNSCIDFFLLPSSWLTVNDHMQCTNNRDASIFVAVSCDHTEPFSHTKSNNRDPISIHIHRHIYLNDKGTSPRRGRLANDSDVRNTFSSSTSCIQDIMGSFLR